MDRAIEAERVQILIKACNSSHSNLRLTVRARGALSTVRGCLLQPIVNIVKLQNAMQALRL
jgi:hypothetical protein